MGMDQTPHPPSARERFESLVPFYVNGTLGLEDRAFMQDCLQRHPDWADDLAFAGHIRQAMRALAPEERPDARRINRLLQRWKEEPVRATAAPTKSNGYPRWMKGLAMALSGAAMAAAAGALVLGVSLPLRGHLHWDSLDGQPDVRLALAPGVDPVDEGVLAALENHDAVMVQSTQQPSGYVIEVDLLNRAATQKALISAMQNSGHIHGYTLLASQ